MRKRIRRSVKPDPIRLILRELERREAPSQSLSILAAGIPAASWLPDANMGSHVAQSVGYQTPSVDTAFLPLSFVGDQSTTPPAEDSAPPASTPPLEDADALAAGSGWWGAFGDEVNEDIGPPTAAPTGGNAPAATPPGGGGGSGAPANLAAPAATARPSAAAASGEMAAPALRPNYGDGPSTPSSSQSSGSPPSHPGMTPDFTSPSFTAVANPFAVGSGNVWVMDVNNGVTVLPGVTQHAFSEWSVDLRAQAIGKAVSSYSWDTTDASDASSPSTSDNQLTFAWATFSGAAHSDSITLTTTFTDSTTNVQTLTFVVNSDSSPAWTADPVTTSDTWQPTQAPDEMTNEATEAAGPYVTLGLASGQVETSHSLPTYNPDVPALTLMYNSTTADSLPIFLVDYTLPVGEAVPSTVTATLTLNGTAGTPVVYDTSTANAGDVIQIALQANATSLATGRYSYSVAVDDPADPDDVYANSFSGSVDLLNNNASPFGAGWTLSGLERVWPVSGGDIVEYPGGTSFFQGNGLTIETVNSPGEFTSFTQNIGGTFTQTFPDGTLVNFNSSGYQTSVIDRNGNTTTYGYNGSNQLTTITDPHGLVTTLAYTSGLLSSITEPSGAVTTFSHDGSGNLTGITDADSAAWAYGYDGANRLTKVTDPNSQVATITYGAGERASEVDLADGSSRELTPMVTEGLATGGDGTTDDPAPAYLVAAAYTEFDDGLSSPWWTQFDWGGFGSPVQQIAPDGEANLTYVDGNDLAWLTADPLAERTRTFFDGDGNPTVTVAPDDTVTTVTYNSFSEPLTVTDADDHTTTYGYDSDGNNTTITDANDHVTTQTFNSAGFLTSSTDAYSHTTTYTYDSRDRLVSETDPLGNTTDTGYDAASNPIWTATPLNMTADGEFRVNTHTTGNQGSPKVATDATGDYVVVWESYGQDGSDYGVYAQRYNRFGTAEGSEFKVNSYTTGDQFQPTVAMDAEGDFVIAWADISGSHSGIYAQRYNAAGTAAGSNFLVSGTMSTIDSPAVAMDANGDFVVAWQTYGAFEADFGGFEPPTDEIYAQRYNAAGTAQGTIFQVNGSTTGVETGPAVAMDAEGDFVVTWTGYNETGSGGYGVYAQRYNAAGTALGSGEFAIGTSGGYSAAVAMDAAGDFVVAWQSYEFSGGITAQRYNASGSTVGSSFLVNTNTITTDWKGDAAVAMDAPGDFVVAWKSYAQDGSSYGVYAQRYNAAGTAVGSEYRLNSYTTNSQTLPAVAMDAPGDIVAAWQSYGQDGSSNGIYAQRYTVAAITVTTYDAMHRPLTTSDPLGDTTTFTYYTDGNLHTLTDPDNNTTTYTYDGLNRELTEIDPLDHTTTYGYDLAGNLTSDIDRDGRERTFDYDLVGDRVDEVWWSGSTVVEEINYFYYQAGQLNEAYDDSTYVAYSYDSLGRVTNEYETNDDSYYADLDYTYDAAGNLTSVSDGTDEVDYTYTPTNQLATAGLSLIGGSLGANVSLSYDSDERLSGETRREGTSGDTVSTSYIYDYASELTEINNTSSAAGALSSFNYGHDDGGRVTT